MPRRIEKEFEAMTAVIQILVPIMSAIVGFYSGKRTAEGAD